MKHSHQNQTNKQKTPKLQSKTETIFGIYCHIFCCKYYLDVISWRSWEKGKKRSLNSPLHKQPCPCRIGARGRCWRGTNWRVGSGAWIGGPFSQKYLQCLFPSSKQEDQQDWKNIQVSLKHLNKKKKKTTCKKGLPAINIIHSYKK